jgi:hypothetical protein
MTQKNKAQWELTDEFLEQVFRRCKEIIESQNDKIFFNWSRTALSEVTPNVKRSLHKKFKGCEEEGYSAAKIAGLYTFWIAKLKPGFSILETTLVLNEYLALCVGIAIIRERLSIEIKLDENEFLGMCDALRYHTSSPHMLMNLYELWIEREELKSKTPPDKPAS